MIKSPGSFMKGYIAGSKLWTPDRDNSSALNRGFRARGTGSGGELSGFYTLLMENETKAKQLLFSCGIRDKVLITGIGQTGGHSLGIMFDSSGMLTLCCVKSKYDWADDRHFGLYEYENCKITNTSPVMNYRPNAIMSPFYHIYYSKEYADRYDPNYDCLVFAWDRQWVTPTMTSFSAGDVPFYSRSKGGTNWSTGVTKLSNGFSSSVSGWGATSFSGPGKGTVKFLF